MPCIFLRHIVNQAVMSHVIETAGSESPAGNSQIDVLGELNSSCKSLHSTALCMSTRLEIVIVGLIN